MTAFNPNDHRSRCEKYLSRFLESQLFEVSAADPIAYAVVSVLLLVIAAVATLVPAWRATRIDPLLALRAE